MPSSQTSKFVKDALAFMKTRALCPPNEVENYRGRLATTLDTSSFSPTATTANYKVDSVGYRVMPRDRKVAYVELYEDRDRSGIMAKTDLDGNIISRGEQNIEGIGVIRFRSSFDERPGWAPVYFQPWDSSGAIVRLRIPPKGTTDPDPDIFLTAAINGCSVFVQGSADSPTLYHAGGDTGQSDHNQAARFWREALAKHIRDSASARGRGSLAAEVNKTEYVKTPGTVGNATTPRAQEYERWLKAKLDKAGRFTVTMVNPWGCVMGIRTGTTWSFYLQENATVICNIVTKTGVEQRCYARPMALRQIFPGGASLANMQMKVPVKIS
ncbi:MAG TPA: hypothetical protein VFS08_13275 [Gemmatimonadaceae bacterium]|nr:hypothetical protein [Gemmatimonadaceae bacterium]